GSPPDDPSGRSETADHACWCSCYYWFTIQQGKPTGRGRSVDIVVGSRIATGQLGSTVRDAIAKQISRRGDQHGGGSITEGDQRSTQQIAKSAKDEGEEGERGGNYEKEEDDGNEDATMGEWRSGEKAVANRRRWGRMGFSPKDSCPLLLGGRSPSQRQTG